MFIDKVYGGVHSWKKIKEKIDVHGQIVWVYKCKRCGVLGRQYSPKIRPRIVLTIYKVCENDKSKVD